jgi:hypothetical protein
VLHLHEAGRRKRAIETPVHADPKLATATHAPDLLPVAFTILVVVVKTDDGVKGTFAGILVGLQVREQMGHQLITLRSRDDKLHLETI